MTKEVIGESIGLHAQIRTRRQGELLIGRDFSSERIFIPGSALLEQPHLIKGGTVEAREEFYELARSRVTLRNKREHRLFGESAFWPRWKRSAGCVVYQFQELENNKRQITALEISVDNDALRGEYEELIPYVIEHEIYEAWLDVKPGLNPWDISKKYGPIVIKSKPNHWLAVRRALRMAMNDGRAEKLIRFYNNREYPRLLISLDYIPNKLHLKHEYNQLKNRSIEPR